MTSTSIKLPVDLQFQVDSLVREFDFETQEDFFKEAIRDKVLELQKILFFQGTDMVAKGLKGKKVSSKDILTAFESKIHQ